MHVSLGSKETVVHDILVVEKTGDSNWQVNIGESASWQKFTLYRGGSRGEQGPHCPPSPLTLATYSRYHTMHVSRSPFIEISEPAPAAINDF